MNQLRRVVLRRAHRLGHRETVEGCDAAALLLEERIAGVCVLAGWLLPSAREALPRAVNAGEGSRVLICHSPNDEQASLPASCTASSTASSSDEQATSPPRHRLETPPRPLSRTPRSRSVHAC